MLRIIMAVPMMMMMLMRTIRHGRENQDVLGMWRVPNERYSLRQQCLFEPLRNGCAMTTVFQMNFKVCQGFTWSRLVHFARAVHTLDPPVVAIRWDIRRADTGLDVESVCRILGPAMLHGLRKP